MKKYKNYIEQLWSNGNHIFENENDFRKTFENGVISQKTNKFLSKEQVWNATVTNVDKDKSYSLGRKYDPDTMIKKIKAHLLQSILDFINSFGIMKYCEIDELKKELINSCIRAYCNLIYLRQKLYNVLSNDSSKPNKYTNKEKVIRIKQKNPIFFYFRFCITIQDCLDLFRYEKQNSDFKNNLVEFLIEEYKLETKKNIKDIKDIKDYLVSLILLVYNYERFFYLRKKNSKKNKNN